MKLSIVTPSFNQGDVIAETLHSVLDQRGDFEIEYRIFDGGSTDETLDVLRRFDDFVRRGVYAGRCRGIEFGWVSEADRGQSHAINKGMSTARGDVVAWINSDDVYFPGAFARVTREFSRAPSVEVVYGDGDVIDEDGRRSWWWRSKPHDYELHRSFCFLWNDFLNHILQPSCFWRRRVVEKVGLLDESFHYAMDHEYWLRMGAAGCRFRHIRQPFARFRMVTGIKSLSSPTVFWPDELEIRRRHLGVASLEPTFAYYVFNRGMQGDLDVPGLRSALARVVEGLVARVPDEAVRMRVQAERAFAHGCLLLSTWARQNGESDLACACDAVVDEAGSRLRWSRDWIWNRTVRHLPGFVWSRLQRALTYPFAVFRAAVHRGNRTAEGLLKGVRYGL